MADPRLTEIFMQHCDEFLSVVGIKLVGGDDYSFSRASPFALRILIIDVPFVQQSKLFMKLVIHIASFCKPTFKHDRFKAVEEINVKSVQCNTVPRIDCALCDY